MVRAAKGRAAIGWAGTGWARMGRVGTGQAKIGRLGTGLSETGRSRKKLQRTFLLLTGLTLSPRSWNSPGVVTRGGGRTGRRENRKSSNAFLR
jgi:hypothetical protein